MVEVLFQEATVCNGPVQHMNMLMIIFHEGIITLSPLHGKGKLWCLHASTEPNTPTWVKRGLPGLCGFLCGFGTEFGGPKVKLSRKH